MSVLNTIATVRAEFKKENLEPPMLIVLSSRDDGHKFMSSILNAQTEPLLNPITLADGSAWIEIKVYDIAIRWPAKRLKLESGQVIHV